MRSDMEPRSAATRSANGFQHPSPGENSDITSFDEAVKEWRCGTDIMKRTLFIFDNRLRQR